MTKSLETERIFFDVAREVGFEVKEPVPIVCEKPVEDKNGENKKTKTLPDGIVVDLDMNRLKHVEITSGSGNSHHKDAQRRVIEAAGQADNYALVTGNMIKELRKKKTKAEKKAFIITIFGWLLLI